MHDHPVNPESIAKLTESRSKESLLYRHKYLASVGQCRKDALGLAYASGEWKDAILHARIAIGGTELAGADVPKAEPMRSAYLTLNTESESRTGEGFGILNEAPGYLKRTEIGSNWSERFVVMYDTDLFPFGRTLNPGETFESAKSSLVFFYDNHGLNDPRWVVPRCEARVIARRHGTEQPPWIFNTWEPFLRGITEQTVKELAHVANQIGLDIFTIDDGWQREYGSNEFDATRFPAGFAGVKTILDSNHLRLGLWVPLAAISTQAPAYRSHPEWVCRDQSGAPKFTGTAAGTRAVMCLASGYRDLALRRLTQLIERYRPAYVKVDLTTVFNAYGEQPGCYALNHWHRGWAESLTRIYQALEHIGDQLYRTHPEVLIDYTFELWGEKAFD